MRLLTDDLDAMLDATEPLHRELGGSRVLLTGGTGFFGRWLLESWVDASDRLGLRRTAVVVTRDPVAFSSAAPHLATHRSVQLVRGDVCGPNPVSGSFDACIHAATAASLALTQAAPRVMFDTVVHGTSNVLAWLETSGAIPLLLTSSGAIYGTQDPRVEGIDEGTLTGPDPLDRGAVYGEGKRAAEMLCAISPSSGPQARIARCFAFVGAHLPLDAHFAIGNFIRDAMAGGPIVIQGDGTPVRSYLYARDLVVWLWTILLRGTTLRPYNVGSSAGVGLRELAERVARAVGGVEVDVRGTPDPSRPAPRYVPDVARARSELGLDVHVGLDEAIERTIRWHRAQPGR